MSPFAWQSANALARSGSRISAGLTVRQRLLEAEQALDHQIGNQVQRAYLRTDFLEQRRELTELWADHLRNGTGAS